MQVVLEARVDDRMMRIGPRKFVTRMQINTITVEECCECEEQHVHVDWHQHWQHKQRQCSNRLIEQSVGDDSERRRIEEHMMVFVLIPEEPRCVTESMIEKFEKVGNDDDENKRAN